MSTRHIQVKAATAATPIITDIWTQEYYESVLNSIPAYERPADWIALPVLVEGDQKFIGLYAVYNTDSNFVALSAAGNYTVDWGDGVVENFATGVQANHSFNYSAFAAQAETSRGYKQAIVTVTPQSGELLTVISTQKKHSQTGLGNYKSAWLDIIAAGQSISALNIGGTTSNTHTLEQFEFVGSNVISNLSTALQNCYSLVNIKSFHTTSVTNFTSLFQGCQNLKKVPLLDTSSGTNFTSMLNGCHRIKTIPLLDTSSGTNFTNMFYFCFSLQTIPLLNMSSATDLTTIFNNCYSLTTIPLLNTLSVKTFTNMFNNCYSLTTIPLLNTSAGITFTNMFSNCFSLREIPLLNLSAGTTFTCMFSSCSSLNNVPVFDTSNGTTFNGMFSGCSSVDEMPSINTSKGLTFVSMFSACLGLKSVPMLDTSNGTDFTSMFQSCLSLQTVPNFNTAAGLNFSYMFSGCSSLQVLPQLNQASATNVTGFMSLCNTLKISNVINTKISIDYSPCMLSTSALETIFNNLGPGAAQAIAVTNLWGAPALINKSSIASTANSKTISVAATTGLLVGMEVYGAFITGNRTVTLTTGTNLLTFNGHALPASQKVSFTTTAAGITLNTIYYVINPTANTFQISLTPGGAAVTISASTTIAMRAYPKIVTVNTNVSIVLDIPAAATGSNTLTAQTLQRSIALLKGWTVTG